MLVRLREWWNRPDPMTAIILWQMDQTMEWVNKWHDKRNWSRLWKQAATKWYRVALSWQAWGEAHKAETDRRGELLKQLNDPRYLAKCPFCFGGPVKGWKVFVHTADCELRKELG